MADDPRTHITPDAFSVAPDLLGLALATPSRRLFAIVIDLGLAAVIARTGIEFLIAAAAALFAWRAIGGPAERLLAGRGRTVFRAATALLALIVVINVWNTAASRLHILKEGDDSPAAGTTARSADANVDNALERLGLSATDQAFFLLRFTALQMADEESGRLGAELGHWVSQRTTPGAARDELVAEMASTMKPEARDAFLGELGRAPAPGSAGVPDTGQAGEARTPAAGGSAVDTAPPTDSQRTRAAPLGPDSVQRLAEANRELRRTAAELREQAEEARDGDQERGGVRSWLSGISDQLGLGFGWFALYFTAFTVLGRGQTPGKRLLGIKVLRLDNKPIGWWLAFERFGGYAASFSTGLLGFAQILWDRNRQALHDKAVGTVVIRLRHGQPLRVA